ncbi:dihydroxyacetone kinase subunit DhaL [Leucobacter albus]|uniref:Dihydroxyacetone kinase subunit DhaL n=1 Tax=Leucobacter albus TaxID=272210 RepID=A0ABW3TP76_9MICO
MTDVITLSQLTAWLRRYSDTVTAERQYLTDLDAAIGDADHGSNMSRGMAAAVAKIDEATPESVGAFGKAVGMTLVSTVGGASGPLYGTLFLRFGATGGDATELDAAALAAALRAGVDGVIARGKAEAGDKTMLDALLPAVAELEGAAASGAGLAEAAAAAAAAAEAGRDATAPLVAHKGRASYLGERSAGHIDPGAASSALLLRALADELAGA